MKKLARVATNLFIVAVCSLAATVYTSNLPVAGATEVSTTTHRVKQAGISIAFPDSWVVFDPTEAESRAVFDAAVEQVPALEQFPGAAADSEDTSVLRAIQIPGEGAPAVVFGMDSFPEQRVTEPVSLLRAQLQAAEVFDSVVVRATKVAGRHAVKADCILLIDEATSSGVEIVLYEFVGSRGGVVMVFASPLGDLPEQEIRAAVKSVRFLG
jgi:hypothetical protein